MSRTFTSGQPFAYIRKTVHPAGNASPDLSDAATAISLLREAAQLNLEDPSREGSLLRFGTAGQLVITGDMHGNLRNFDKLQRFCALDRSPARYVILQELVHEDLQRPGQIDFSIDLLVRAVAWKSQFPDNVFFLQSNHELAQLRNQEITKGGRSVLHDFECGVARRYGAMADAVLESVDQYIDSLALAARTANGIFISHSLPEPLTIPSFDTSVFSRRPTDGDLSPGGPAYSLVWGRFHSAEAVQFFARRVGVELCVVGHTPQEMGYSTIGNMLIIASDHAHGAFLPVDLSRRYTIEEIEDSVRKFAGVE